MYAKKNVSMKAVAVLLALVMLLGGAIGGTLAWLMDSTTPVTNTFTTSDVDIELAETKSDFKMVPGNDIEKDPKVTVKANSEACWLFVKVEKANEFDKFMTYGIADGWTPLADVDGVYYREVAASDADQGFPVLADDKVHVLETVTKDMMETDEANLPTLTFTAYAVQRANVADVAAAWNIAQGLNPDDSQPNP